MDVTEVGPGTEIRVLVSFHMQPHNSKPWLPVNTGPNYHHFVVSRILNFSQWKPFLGEFIGFVGGEVAIDMPAFHV